MNEAAYSAVTSVSGGAGGRLLSYGFLRVTGRDRAKYLQGQLSNDIVAAVPGQSLDACLLNNTGHLLAYVIVYVFDDEILLATDVERVSVLRQTLEKYIVRERVEIEPASLSLLTVQGDVVQRILGGSSPIESAALRAGHVLLLDRDGLVFAAGRLRYTASAGVDIVVKRDKASEVLSQNCSQELTTEIDDETAHILRVESGERAWGAELDESIIPLEAGLESAISYTKGCYMGQEIIARIHSRGHTNRTLVGLKIDGSTGAGTTLIAIDGERSGENVGRITSVALSPRYGKIALGYVRNEYAPPGTELKSEGAAAVISSLPFSGSVVATTAPN